MDTGELVAVDILDVEEERFVVDSVVLVEVVARVDVAAAKAVLLPADEQLANLVELHLVRSLNEPENSGKHIHLYKFKKNHSHSKF